MSIRRQGILVLVTAAIVVLTVIGACGGLHALAVVLGGLIVVALFMWVVMILCWAIYAAFTGESLFGKDWGSGGEE